LIVRIVDGYCLCDELSVAGVDMVNHWRNFERSAVSAGENSLFNHLSVPKYLVIANRRLTIFYRFLELLAVLLVIAGLHFKKPWFYISTPISKGHRVWSERAAEAALASSVDPQHCSNAFLYNYSVGLYQNPDGTESPAIQYTPDGCQTVSRPEETGSVFLPTYAHEKVSWRSSACDDEEKSRCLLEHGGTFSNATQSGTSQCVCESDSMFLAKNVDDDIIYFEHGYEVSTNTVGSTMRGHSAYDQYEVDSVASGVSAYEGDILTLIQLQDGNPCVVSGKSAFKFKDSQGVIRGTVTEWLACSGTDLDTRIASLRRDGAVTEDAPYLRLAGMVLQFDLRYFNHEAADIPLIPAEHRDFEGVICVVRVTAIPKWNRRHDLSLFENAGPFTVTDRSTMRSRYDHGISVSFTTSGAFAFFDIWLFLAALVHVIVLIGMPHKFIMFFALNCLGLVSTIYQKAQQQVMTISHAFHGASARMMVSSVGYRGLTSQWGGHGSKLSGLRFNDLEFFLSEIFCKQVKHGVINDIEIEQLTRAVMHGMDKGRSGSIGFEEFVHACAGQETIDVRHMAQYFNQDRCRGPMEMIFDARPKSFYATAQNHFSGEVQRALSNQRTLSKQTSKEMRDTMRGEPGMERCQSSQSGAGVGALSQTPLQVGEVDKLHFQDSATGKEIMRLNKSVLMTQQQNAQLEKRIVQLEDNVCDYEEDTETYVNVKLLNKRMQLLDRMQAKVTKLSLAVMNEFRELRAYVEEQPAAAPATTLEDVNQAEEDVVDEEARSMQPESEKEAKLDVDAAGAPVRTVSKGSLGQSVRSMDSEIKLLERRLHERLELDMDNFRLRLYSLEQQLQSKDLQRQSTDQLEKEFRAAASSPTQAPSWTSSALKPVQSEATASVTMTRSEQLLGTSPPAPEVSSFIERQGLDSDRIGMSSPNRDTTPRLHAMSPTRDVPMSDADIDELKKTPMFQGRRESTPGRMCNLAESGFSLSDFVVCMSPRPSNPPPYARDPNMLHGSSSVVTSRDVSRS